MKTPAELARELGVKTGDQIGAPRRKPTPADHDAKRARWGAAEKAVFKRLGPSAMYIAGAKQLVSVTVFNDDGTRTMFGHNRPQRPVRVGTTGLWRDTVTNDHNRNPYFWQGLLMRIWTPAEVHSKGLAALTAEALLPLAEPSALMNRFVALSDDVALDVLEKELHIMAWQQGIPTWDDAGLSSEIEHVRVECKVDLDDPKTIIRAAELIVRRAHRVLERRA